MTNSPLRGSTLALLACVLASPALAQSADEPAAGGGIPPLPPAAVDDLAPSAMPTPSDRLAGGGGATILTAESTNQVLAAKIVGMEVLSVTGERIATVDDVLLDKSGAVSGLVLSAGGILGLGSKLVAISWRDLGAVENVDAIRVNLTPDQLDAAPEFRTKERQQAEALRNLQVPAPAAGQ